MKLAIDPYMFRRVPLLELPSLVAELGYQWIELPPREDFAPFFTYPRTNDSTIGDRFLVLKRGRSLGESEKQDIDIGELTRLMAGGAELDALAHELRRG